MIPLCIKLSRKLRKNISCYVLLNRIHHSAKDFSHIDSLLSKSKHLKMRALTLYYTIKLSFVKELFMTQIFTWMGLG